MTATATSSISILGNESIFVGHGLLSWAAKDLRRSLPNASTYVLIADSIVMALYGDAVRHAFSIAADIEFLSLSFTAGEPSKTRATKEMLENSMLEAACGRNTVIVALGGGVTGDMAGYIAATYMRGIPFVQLPTSLLAMVDSSIGGKTGVDTVHGKNLIGSFHQPHRVYIDLDFLRTLPDRQLRNGMAEIIKSAAILDCKLFEYLEQNVLLVLKRDMGALYHIVHRSAQIKSDIVTQDEKEGGIRSLLNFGHTLGHAIEILCQPEMLHGEAVAIGMRLEVEIARAVGALSQSNVGRVLRCIQAYGFSTTLPKHLITADLFKKMAVDKKNEHGLKRIVILANIGVTTEPRAITVEDRYVRRVLSQFIAVRPQKAVNGSLAVPGSKSISNRVLVLAGLGEGTCSIHGLLHSDDTQVMMDAMKTLGACSLEWTDDGNIILVHGRGGSFSPSQQSLPLCYLGNAGTASRFLTSVCALMPSGVIGEHIELTGNPRMQERPIGPLVDALRSNGVSIEYLNREGSLPLRIHTGGLKGGTVHLAANISSQYVSSLLMSLPYSCENSTLDLIGDTVVSQSYIDITVGLMRQFGVNVEAIGDKGHCYNVPRAIYTNPSTFLVEGDASSSTYPLAIAAITYGCVTVTNVGSSSLQGDSNFGKLLESMGCLVVQTSTTTTVTGPSSGTRLKCFDMDMSGMTDAFMTAAVLAAVAEGTSFIRNIANQRVKECDRIAAMVSELSKLGCHAYELHDGIAIEGVNPESMRPAIIDCRDDHRIAMSFAVLGCCVTGVLVSERSCVEKTYAEFWDDLETKLGLELYVPEDKEVSSLTSSIRTLTTSLALTISSHSPVILVGMRGVGKSHLGRGAARLLGRDFIDLDDFIVARLREGGIYESIAHLVKCEGWSSFRNMESAMLENILLDEKYRNGNFVVACGGGIVEAEKNRELLIRYRSRVIQIRRPITNIVTYLESDATRPSLNEDIMSLWSRRAPLYDAVSDWDFFVLCEEDGSCDWEAAVTDFSRLLNRIDSNSSRLLEEFLRHPTFFVSLTFPNVNAALFNGLLSRVCEGAHAIELRVDLLEMWDREFVESQMALLRRYSKLLILFTVRSLGQGGRHPDSDEVERVELLRLGCRLGCEIVDIETVLSQGHHSSLMESFTDRLLTISSYHAVNPNSFTWCDIVSEFKMAASLPTQIVKVVVSARSIADVYRLRESIVTSGVNKPTIALAMGDQGTLSRALNTFLTPVTHAAMPFKAAPGQLTVVELHQLRHLLGVLPSKRCYLFGTPISASMSPTLHNAGFLALALPYHYELCETDSIDRIATVLAKPSTLGGSVTIPLKCDVMKIISHTSEAARVIGAINTIECRDDDDGNRVLYGHNVDWLGIYRLISRCHKTINRKPIRSGLVLGAGGTARAACYALCQLGVSDLVVWNRTPAKARALSEEFQGRSVLNMDDLSVDVIVSTVPAVASLTVPAPMLNVPCPPIVLDAAYRPRETLLLKQALAAGCPTIAGIDMLVEQGFAQFEIWTGISNPPFDLMRDAVNLAYGE